MITPAFAQTAGAGGGDILSFLFPMVFVFAIFYLMVFRPQQKKVKEHQALIEGVKRGDTVVTAGGIIGKVARVGTDNEVRIEIAEGVQVRVLKSTLADVKGRGEPVKEKAKAETAAATTTGRSQTPKTARAPAGFAVAGRTTIKLQKRNVPGRIRIVFDARIDIRVRAGAQPGTAPCSARRSAYLAGRNGVKMRAAMQFTGSIRRVTAAWLQSSRWMCAICCDRKIGRGGVGCKNQVRPFADPGKRDLLFPA
jgi:preprotein translocase subunit YajC